jgi:hypothetical protein
MSLRKFIEFNDLGFPLAYLASEGLCMLSEEGQECVNQTWDLLLEALNIGEQKFEDIDELINLAMYEHDDILKAINKFMSSHNRNWKK